MDAEALSNSAEAEDGEIVNDDLEEPYIPLERPLVSSSANIKPHPVSESDDDNIPVKYSSDSDSSGTMPNFSKRKKFVSMKKTTIPEIKKKKKKYNIWCSDLQTEVLTDSLVDCNVDQANERIRAVESYNYKLGMPPEPTHNFPDNNKKRFSGKRKYNGDCAGKDRNSRNKCDDKKSEFQLANSRHILSLTTDLESSEEDIAKDIANKLCEEKEELILRALCILGKKTVISLFEETKDIEASGGMLIMNGTRRRTPGGVFFYLLKTSESIPKKKINLVFLEDKKSMVLEKKRTAKELKKIRAAKLREEMSKDDFPTLLSRTELAIKEFKAKKLAKESAEVKNPPPSPATDGRDCSSDGEEQKEGHSNVHESTASQEAKSLNSCKENVENEENNMDVV